MSGVDGTGRVGSAGRPGSSRVRRVAGGFAVPSEPPATPPSADVAEAAPVALDMVALQEIGGSRHREARRHGKRLIAALTGLQRALLTGPVDTGALRHVVDAVPDDLARTPELQPLLMRARVELARRGA